jgi:glutathione S-transferase
MKLYTYSGAPNPRRVHIYLAEKGIDLPFEEVDIMKRANRTEAFIDRVNSMGGLPVLELDDGTHIAESIAICRYLEAANPQPSLFGTTAKEQGLVEMWIRRIELNLMVPVGMVWVHGSPLTRRVMKNQIAEVAEQNRVLVGHYFSFLDRHLRGQPFLAGERFTMPDIVALTTLDFAAQLNGLPHPPKLENLSRWYDAVSSRPSASS